MALLRPCTMALSLIADITRQYEQAIRQQLIPAYGRLYTFLEKD